MSLQVNLKRWMNSTMKKKISLGGWLMIFAGLIFALFLFSIFSGKKRSNDKTEVATEKSSGGTTLVVNLDPLRDGPFIITEDPVEFTLRNTPDVRGHEVSWLWGSGASIGIEDMHGNVYTLEDGKNVRFNPDIKNFMTFKAWLIPGSKVKKTTLTVVEKLPSVKLKK